MQTKFTNTRNFTPYIVTLFMIAFSMLSIGQTHSEPSSDTVRVESNENKKAGTYVKGLTSARAKSLVGGVIALASVVLGWRVNTGRTRNGKTMGRVGLLLATVAIVLSVVHLAGNTGAFGTGGGKAGAIVALLLALLGIFLNRSAFRSDSRGG